MDRYLHAPPRCGLWLSSVFPVDQLSILEIAGGSCRDSRYLADTMGCTVVATDFDGRTLEYLQHRYPDSRLVLQREDAGQLSFPDKRFDLSFHNGFWSCCQDDDKLRRLLLEQARVTKRYLVILVHNAHNRKLMRQFQRLQRRDKIYAVRFFNSRELADLVKSSGLRWRRIRLCKFGGPPDVAYRLPWRNNRFGSERLAARAVAQAYRLQAWATTERIACVVELK